MLGESNDWWRGLFANELQNDAIEFVGDVTYEFVGELRMYPLAVILLKWLDNDMSDVDAICVIVQLYFAHYYNST